MTTTSVVATSNLSDDFTLDVVAQKVNVKGAKVWLKQSDDTQASTTTDAIHHTGNVAVKQAFAVRSGGNAATSASLNATDKSVIRLTTAGTIGGITGAEDGKYLTLINTSTGTVKLTHAASASTEKLLLPNDTDMTVTAGSVVDLIYDQTSTAWRCKSQAYTPLATRVMVGSGLDPNTTAPVDTFAVGAPYVAGETYLQTHNGLNTGNLLAEWRYVGGTWQRLYARTGVAATVTNMTRTYHPVRSNMLLMTKTDVSTAAQVTAQGFAAHGGATCNPWSAGAAYNGYSMINCTATRAIAATRYTPPTNYVSHTLAVTPGEDNTYFCSTLTDRANFVLLEAWVCDPVTKVPVMRLHSNSQSAASTTQRLSINLAPDNGHEQVSVYFAFMSFGIPKALVDTYISATNSLTIALRPGLNSTGTDVFYLGGWGMATNPFGLITSPVINQFWSGNDDPSPNLTWYGTLNRAAAASVAANGKSRVYIPIMATDKDIILTFIGRETTLTDSAQVSLTLLHASGDVELGRFNRSTKSPYSVMLAATSQNCQAMIIPAATVAAKADTPANSGISYLAIEITNHAITWPQYFFGFATEYAD
ncbi:hypothetical protein J9253_05960 [Thiothrix litoralis]|uniref:Tail fiber protein n=1 Tax=Thiothrix litoralis TaxID=2891210 RepID=A0ABX7WWS6_9GAMM|nr:hypothetical protein [Thiothrix litoralis]QTR47477.1 hypothetical protein J9253_05960 [Thiothrix litoralis]